MMSAMALSMWTSASKLSQKVLQLKTSPLKVGSFSFGSLLDRDPPPTAEAKDETDEADDGTESGSVSAGFSALINSSILD